MSDIGVQSQRLARRAFLRDGSLLLVAGSLGLRPESALFAAEAERRVRVGLVTDLHYADKPPAGSRHYRQSLTKLQEAAAQLQKDQPELVVELGDFIDAADSVDIEMGYLARIQKEFATLPGKKHYVLGNHCVQTLTKAEFLEGVGQKQSHDSLDARGVHFVILDACFRKDGQPYGRNNFEWTDANIPADQVEWLRADLDRAAGKSIVFVHQRLDVNNDHGVKNAAQIRGVLEQSEKVLAVFQGHSHANDLKEINGIHYCTLVAMVEGSGAANSGYSTLDVLDGGVLRLTGYRRQKSYASL